MKKAQAGLCLSLVFLVQTAWGTPPAISDTLTSQIMAQLHVSHSQAEGGAGALFAAAKSNLSQEEFSLLREAIPSMNTLLKAVPELDETGGVSVRFDEYGLKPNTRKLASSFQALHLSPGKLAQFTDVISHYLIENQKTRPAQTFKKSLTDL